MTTPDRADQVSELADVRVVCDTNVLVSAILFPQSVPGQAFARARTLGRVLTTRELTTELRDVLARPKFDRYIARSLRDEFLAAFISEAEFVAITELVTVCRDPDDNHILEAAINGRAACVLSGDDDLLVLSPFRDIPIYRPAEFLLHFATG